MLGALIGVFLLPAFIVVAFPLVGIYCNVMLKLFGEGAEPND